MEFYPISKKGRRETNEDNFIAEKIDDLFVFGIADGMGGHAAGEIASRIAIIELTESIKRKGKNGLKEGVEKANDTIHFENERRQSNMGTTLVACVIKENSDDCTIVNIGDSRAYIINKEIWKTKDQSLVQELVDNGVINKDEAFSHPQKNIVTQALGLEKKVKVDVYEKSVKDSTLLLCSDGLSDYVKDCKIIEIAKKYESKKACNMLYKTAFENESNDNITIIVAKF